MKLLFKLVCTQLISRYHSYTKISFLYLIFQDVIRGHLYDGDVYQSDSQGVHLPQTRVPPGSLESTRFFSCYVWVRKLLNICILQSYEIDGVQYRLF